MLRWRLWSMNSEWCVSSLGLEDKDLDQLSHSSGPRSSQRRRCFWRRIVSCCAPEKRTRNGCLQYYVWDGPAFHSGCLALKSSRRKVGKFEFVACWSHSERRGKKVRRESSIETALPLRLGKCVRVSIPRYCIQHAQRSSQTSPTF